MFDKLKNIFGLKSKSTEYVCASCGKGHNDWPAIAYNTPCNYSNLSEDDKITLAELSSDFCQINYPDQIDRFIRGVLFQQVAGTCEDLEYGLWVSLSEKSFNDYKANYDNNEYETIFFGWTCNVLEGYDDTVNIPVNVIVKPGGVRPEVVPHGDFDHPFVYDYYNGIDKIEAQKRIDSVIKNSIQ